MIDMQLQFPGDCDLFARVSVRSVACSSALDNDLFGLLGVDAE